MKQKIFGLAVLLVALLLAPAYAASSNNISILYGWNGTAFVPVNVADDGSLMTTINMSSSLGLNPELNNTYDLGTAALLWANLYVRSISSGSGPLSLFAGENEMITLLASGNVGIGITNPQQNLVVVGTANITGGIMIPNVTFADGTLQTSASTGTNVSLLYGVNQSNTGQQIPASLAANGALRMSVEQATTVTADGLSAGATGSDLTLSDRLNVTGTTSNSTFSGDVRILGTLYGGSPLKVAGGLNVTGGIYSAASTNEMSLSSLGNTTFDLMEYSTNATAQATYVSNAAYTTDRIPTMTSNTAPSGVASTSDEYDATFTAFKAMNKNSSDAWFTGNVMPQWLQYQFTSGKIITNYTLTAINNGNYVYTPLNWKFLGSNDGSAWTLLDTRTGITFSQGQNRSFTIDNSVSYTYYRINATDNSYSNKRVMIGEIAMMETGALQSYSESAIKTQGTYSLKGIAVITDSLNKNLTHTFLPTINMSGESTIKFDIRASRTGSNIKVGIHDSGGTTTETTPNVAQVDTWQTVTWDISGVANADKDTIDGIIITITNADAANTFYIDNMYTPSAFTATTLTTNGLERVRITGTGYVGIDTTLPNYKLDVNGVINAAGILINNSALPIGLSQSFRGLHLRTGEQGNSATTVVMLHADEIITSNGVRRTPADNLAATITTSGIGGLRASQSEVASTWYKVMYAYGSSGEGLYLEQAKDYFLDEQNVVALTSGNANYFRYDSTYQRVTQGFKVDTTGPIPFVDIGLSKAGSPTGSLWVTIEADSSGNPSGTPLATSQYINVANLPANSGTGTNVRFVFRAPVTVTAATTYWIVLYSDTSTSATNYISTYVVGGNPYANGKYGTYNGAAWSYPGSNAYESDFKTYVTRNDNTVTPPSGYDTGYAQIGWVYNDASSNFKYFRQQDRDYYTYAIFDSDTLTATTQTLTNLSTGIPPSPVRIDKWATLGTVAGARLWLSSSLDNSYDMDVWTQVGGYWEPQGYAVPVEFQHIYYKVSANNQRFAIYGFTW